MGLLEHSAVFYKQIPSAFPLLPSSLPPPSTSIVVDEVEELVVLVVFVVVVDETVEVVDDVVVDDESAFPTTFAVPVLTDMTVSLYVTSSGNDPLIIATTRSQTLRTHKEMSERICFRHT